MSERSDEEVIERIAHELRVGARFDEALDARVMKTVREVEPPVRVAHLRLMRAERDWLLRPRAIRVTPLAGLAAAAGFAMLVATSTLLLSGDGSRVGTTTVANPAQDAEPARTVQFVLRAPNAGSVSLVGDFNEWDASATPLRAGPESGTWIVSLPLSPGRHLYAFVVDGEEWMPDPAAPTAPGDDFGVPNSVITVAAAPGASSS